MQIIFTYHAFDLLGRRLARASHTASTPPFSRPVPRAARAASGAQQKMATGWRRFCLSVLARFNVERCLAWSSTLRMRSVRRALSALCCYTEDYEEDALAGSDAGLITKLTKLPSALRDRIMSYNSARTCAMRAAVCAYENLSDALEICVATARTAASGAVSICGREGEDFRGLIRAIVETFPMLRDLAVLRTVHRAGIKNVETKASRETCMQLILSLRRGSRQGYNDANEKSKFMFAYRRVVAPKRQFQQTRTRSETVSMLLVDYNNTQLT